MTWFYPYSLLQKKEKPTIWVYEFYSPLCPVCERIILNPNSPYNQAKKEAMAKLNLKIIKVDTSTDMGRKQAYEFGVKFVPTVFVRGEPVPRQWLEDKEKMLEVFEGKVVIEKKSIMDMFSKIF